MRLIPEGDDCRLFQIEDVLSTDLAQEISTVDWTNFSWVPVEGQERTARRRLRIETELQNKVMDCIQNSLPAINDNIGTSFTMADTNWWLDGPGYKIGIHTDGHLKSAMQLYWFGVNENYGTVFYNYNHVNHVRHTFKFKQNTGYLMINTLNPDGSQPLMWHGMLNAVPDNAFRLTTYTILR